MIQKNILFEKSAVKEALQYLKNWRDYKWTNIKYINEGRYAIIFGEPNIAITFKKDWFYSFGQRRFRNSENGEYETGIGDTLNCGDLREFVNNQVRDLYVLHKSGQLYSIPLMEFLMQSYRWLNKENKEVRSISIHKYTRVNKDGRVC